MTSEKKEEKCSCAFCPGEFVKIKDAIALIREKKATFLSNDESGEGALLIDGTKKARQFSVNWFIRMGRGQFVVKGWPWKDGGDDVVTIHPLGLPQDCYIVPLCMIERYYDEVGSAKKKEEEERVEEEAPLRKKKPTLDYLFLHEGDRVHILSEEEYPKGVDTKSIDSPYHVTSRFFDLFGGLDGVVTKVFRDGILVDFYDGEVKLQRLTKKWREGSIIPFWAVVKER